ncbi:MAG: triose-phosphate isomerase [Proteobacteria bacterium]|nr:triose-phosphate isomerase [Pseudomonadota bacterium]
MKRKKFLAGNWKMHKLRGDAGDFFKEFKPALNSALNNTGDSREPLNCIDVAMAVPATLFDPALLAMQSIGVKILAQNCHWEKQGAYTGEISPGMLLDAGLQGSLVGHSERRQYFGESDDSVGRKWDALASAGLLPIICVGESRTQRDACETMGAVRAQIETALLRVSPEGRSKEFIIAYEPVWAIGTGLTATPAEAQEVHAFIRTVLAEHLAPKRAGETRIIYGGSMNAANAKELLMNPDIDGGLIGGASLKAEEFLKIITAGV